MARHNGQKRNQSRDQRRNKSKGNRHEVVISHKSRAFLAEITGEQDGDRIVAPNGIKWKVR